MIETPAATEVGALPTTVRGDFPILRNTPDGPPLAYLDNAATAQKPQVVLDALVDYYATANSNVGRGYYKLEFRLHRAV